MENKSIMKATYIFTGLFLLLAVFFSYYLGLKSKDQMNNSYNKLTDKLSESTSRGIIYSKDREVLAETSVNDSGEEYRNYPYNDLFCHVVGSLSYGKYGIESLYNYQLLSSDTNWLSKVFDDLQGDKYKGNNVISTLDVKLQKAAYDAMREYSGAVVIMEADTGKVLTMMSNPAYNPNEASKNWDKISTDESSPILNRVTQGLYTPGSIFKLFTLNEFLNEGNVEGYSYKCNSSINVDGNTISCASKVAHGNVNLIDSFAFSCNCSFINIGNKLSISGLNELCENMLFNSDLPLAFPYKQSKFKLLENDTDFMKAQTYFGQGETLVTPMHMVMVCSAIANNGILMEPMFVEKVENTNGNIIEEYETKEYKRLFSEEDTTTLKTYMRSVVEKGTAIRLNQFKNITVYGKTGTAQINNGKNANSWFIGFAEKDGKSYAIAVVCEKVSNNISPAIVVARDVLKVLD